MITINERLTMLEVEIISYILSGDGSTHEKNDRKK